MRYGPIFIALNGAMIMGPSLNICSFLCSFKCSFLPFCDCDTDLDRDINQNPACNIPQSNSNTSTHEDDPSEQKLFQPHPLTTSKTKGHPNRTFEYL